MMGDHSFTRHKASWQPGRFQSSLEAFSTRLRGALVENSEYEAQNVQLLVQVGNQTGDLLVPKTINEVMKVIH